MPQEASIIFSTIGIGSPDKKGRFHPGAALLLTVAWICLHFMALGAAAEEAGLSKESTLSEIRIEILDPPPPRTDWAAMARSLITMRAGDRFSDAALRQSLAALEQSNRFQKIHVDAEEQGEQIAVVFKLTPFRLVKDIKVSGAYPLFQRKVLNAMTVFPGEPYVAAEITEQDSPIERLFIQQGYINPHVELETWEDPEDGNHVIFVKIQKGAYYRLRSLTMTGNRAFSDQRLKMKMKIWLWSQAPRSSGRFVEKELKEDVKDLVAFYRAKGYPECTIEYGVQQDPETGRVSVALTISEGPRYEVSFSGNAHFWGTTLDKELVVFTEGNRNNRGLQKSLRQIRTLYRRDGFLKASVEVEESQKGAPPETVRQIRFVIQEGPQSIVQSVDISGNHALGSGRIEKQMLTTEPGLFDKGAYTPKKLEEDRRAVETLYLQQGYPDAEIKAEATPGTAPGEVAIAVTIDENRQVRVKTVAIEGLPEISEEEAVEALQLKPGEPFQQKLLKEDEKILSAFISEKGFPFVTTSGKATLSPDRSDAAIVYTVDPGPSVKLGDLYVAGNFRTRGGIIRNELEIEPGDPFSPKRVLKSQKDLRDMGVFNSVQFKSVGLKEKREKADLFIEVEERKPYYLEFGGGYESNQGVFGEAGIGDINFLGRNQKIWFSGKVSQIGYRVDTGIAEPRMFGTRYSAALQAYAERKEEFNQPFGTKQYGASLTFTRKWFEKLTATLKFDFEERDQFPTETNAENAIKDDLNEFRSRTVVVATPGIAYDTRDSFIRPKKGLFAFASVNLSKGVRDDFDSFFRYRIDLRGFRTPWPRVTFAALGRAGYIDPYGNELKVPDDQLFFLGGIENVRGYDENLLAYDATGTALGGRTAAVMSLESRIDLGLDFELTLFYDTGLVSDTYDSLYDESWRSSVGVGLRYITPIGPMGLLYGHKIDPRPGESDGRWHLSIGYTF